MANFADVVSKAMASDFGTDRRLVAVKLKPDAITAVPFAIVRDARDDDDRAMVATHGIERDQRLGWQGESAPSRQSCGAVMGMLPA